MKTTTATVRIRLDQAVTIEEQGLNLSEFVREKLDEEFGSNDFLAAKEKELLDQLEKIKQFKKETQTIKKEMKEEEKAFIERISETIRKNGIMTGSVNNIIDGCRVYNEKFKKRIDPKQFEELIGIKIKDGEII